MDFITWLETRYKISAPAIDESLLHYRHPHPDIVGKVKIHGDIFQTTTISDWDLP